MTKNFIAAIVRNRAHFIHRLKVLAPGLAALMLTAGCQTDSVFLPAAQPGAVKTPDIITLREGDVLKITFPGNANLNTTQAVRRDGMISMPLVGELKAVGKTLKQLESELLDLYSTQLVSKEVTVELQSSTYPVYVNGSVLRPGKIMSDRPLTAFEAIMEAGGPDYAKANLKGVVVIRQEGGSSRKFILNLKLVMEGKSGEPFYLKPGDTVYVPEKFNWF